MALIDSNVLVYAADTECREYEAARKFLRARAEGSDLWHLTWQNVFECIRFLTDPRTIRGKPLYIDEALEMMRRLLLSPSLQLIHPGQRHFEIFSEIAARTSGTRGLFVHDVRLAAIMLENGVRTIYTADEGFRRFRDIEVINPFH